MVAAAVCRRSSASSLRWPTRPLLQLCSHNGKYLAALLSLAVIINSEAISRCSGSGTLSDLVPEVTVMMMMTWELDLSKLG